MNTVLAGLVRPGPKASRAASRRIEDLCNEANEGAADLRKVLEAYPEARSLLIGIAEGSNFLWRLLMQDAGRAAALLSSVPQERLTRLCFMARSVADLEDEAEAMRRLRRLRSETALLIAMADLGGVWTVEQVTEGLSEFADASVQGAFRFLLNAAVRDGHLSPSDLANPETGLGMFILALGKHGARELNYSSDIDLTVFFEPDAPAFAFAKDPQVLAIRLIKGIVKLLQDRTGDGYVHRVDLRLRPDPGSTPIVIPVEAGLSYYETVGQNWERAAMIKARPVAGDIEAGNAFLKELRPFIWRKYFDYAAIADIHAMKRQIYAVKGHETVAILGHDVKVGRGGIREIEFFVQTQQLVYGGRRPDLRGSRTLDMLQRLHIDGWITAGAASDLTEAYCFLRGIEHRIQMVGDEQTQRLPSQDEDLDRFARFCGYTRAGFEKALTKRLLSVESHYARLFEAMPGLASTAGSLVFTGVEDDPETLETLRRLGFIRPELAAETVRGWHFGRRTAVTSPRSREILTELVPALLESFGNSSDPDAALSAFDAALGHMPAAVELFAILKNNPNVRGLFAELLGSAPRLAEVVSRAPHVLDVVVDPDFTRQQESQDVEHRARIRLMREGDMESFLEHARTMVRHEQFLAASQMISGVVPALDIGRVHADIAEAFLRIVLERVYAELAEKHGLVPEARMVILGYGKLGSREMTATSDLDLVVIYDCAPDIMSDGKRSLYASEWFSRLTQRLVTALSAQLRSGLMYEIDLRLRPSGKKGPVAVSLNAFKSYHREEAELWEHMALSRARPVAGDAGLMRDISDLILALTTLPRDAKKVAREVSRMRALIAEGKEAEGRFDFKLMPGGLVDLEFIAQYLVLSHAANVPELAGQGPLAILETAGKLNLLPADDASALADAYRLYTGLTQFLRIVLINDAAVQEQPDSFKRKLAQTAGLPSFKLLLTEIDTQSKTVRRIFTRLLGAVKV